MQQEHYESLPTELVAESLVHYQMLRAKTEIFFREVLRLSCQRNLVQTAPIAFDNKKLSAIHKNKHNTLCTASPRSSFPQPQGPVQRIGRLLLASTRQLGP